MSGEALSIEFSQLDTKLRTIVRGLGKLSNYRKSIILYIDYWQIPAKIAICRHFPGNGSYAMDVRFVDPDLERIELDQQFNAGHSWPVVKAFRKRMQLIRAARDERDFYALKSLHYEKLRGNRSHQKSMRLNDKWRLIVEIDEQNEIAVVVLVEITDYH